MSFILDALKKSEERRRIHEDRRTPRQKIFDLSWSGPRRWPVGLFLILLIAALAGGWLLRGAALPPEPKILTENLPPAAPLPGDAAPTGAVAPPSSGNQAGTAPFAPVPEASFGKSASPPRGLARTAPERETPPAARLPKQAPAAAAPAVKPRPVASGIPAALRGRMTELTMSLHFYTDDPARRMVRIDNRIVREGQLVADDLRLEEITPTGAIFSLGGERFQVHGPGQP